MTYRASWLMEEHGTEGTKRSKQQCLKLSFSRSLKTKLSVFANVILDPETLANEGFLKKEGSEYLKIIQVIT
jgi:hypothetical protein